MRVYIRALLTLIILALAVPAMPLAWAGCPLTKVQMDTNPSYDVILTRTTPLLSFKNAEGGDGSRSYELEMDTSAKFDSTAKFTYKINENPEGVTALQIEDKKSLKDKTMWWWRVRAVDMDGTKGTWSTSRFTVDTASDDHFMNLTRAIPLSVKVSGGSNPENLIDYSDQGLNTQWRSTPPGDPVQWVELDLGKEKTISRIWMLAGFQQPDGWPTDFTWKASTDGVNWQVVEGGVVTDADTYRFILDVTPTKARFWRLEISKWQGYAVALNELLLYSPGMPPVPSPPKAPYVLVVGNQHNGFTFTKLAKRITELVPEVRTLSVPHHEVSMAMLEALTPKPVAIFLSGNNANYNELPMFEYNGEYEIIRKADIPTLGICAGIQMHAFAYGYTRVRSMGWSDISAMKKPADRTRIDIIEQDPIFKGINSPFVAPEVHGWAVYSLPEDYQLIAKSTYVQSIRRKDGMRHGVQFHPEIKVDYNQAESVIVNLINDAMKK